MFLAAQLGAGCADEPLPSEDASDSVLADDDAHGEQLEGTLRQFIADYADGTHEVGYALETATGERIELAFDEAPKLDVGETVRVAGSYMSPGAPGARQSVRVSDGLFKVARAVKLEQTSGLGRAQQAIVDGTPRTLRVAVVLVNFQGSSAQGFSPDTARQRMSEVRSYYQEISYGIWNLEYEVFGPFEVPRPPNCGLDTIENAARGALSASGVSADSFDNVAVTLPSNDATGFDCACGLAWVGRAPAVNGAGVQRFSLYTCTDSNAFAHELGHNFGLGHASTANCSGQAYRRDIHNSCSLNEYGNSFNTMGNGLGHMNGYQKSTFKWLDRCNTVRVSKDAVFDLTPIQLETEDVQVLQVSTGDARDGHPLYYYVEYRNPALATFNAKDGGTVREKGIGLHIDVATDFRDGDGTLNPLLLDVAPGGPGNFSDPRLKIGESFADPDGRVTVSLLEASSEKARVQVSFPGGGSGANLCADGSAPPGSDGPRAAGTLFQHCDFGGWAVSLVPGDYTRDDLLALGVMDNDASSLSLSEGYEAIMYDQPDLTGDPVTLGAASACFVNEGFNDALSSLTIRAIGAVDDGAPVDDGQDDGLDGDDAPADDGSQVGDGGPDDDGAVEDGEPAGDGAPVGDGDTAGDGAPVGDGQALPDGDGAGSDDGHQGLGCSVATHDGGAGLSGFAFALAALALLFRKRARQL